MDDANRKRQRVHRILRASIVTLLPLVAVLLGIGVAQGEPTGRLVVAQYEDAASLDPTMSTRRSDIGILRLLMFDPLVARNAQGEFVPGLATAWRAIDDTTWEFELRHGVVFHDETPFDATSVKFTFEKITDPAGRTAQGFLWEGISHVEIIDDHLVRIHTHQPFGPLLAHLSLGAMLPPHFDPAVHATNPIGTGPFRFVEWRRGERIVVEAFPGFWGEPPGVKEVVFLPIIEDSTRMAGVLAGDIHIAHPVPVQLVPVLDRVPDVDVMRVLSPITQHLSLGGLARPPVGGDPRVLEAIDLAIDRQALVERVFSGQAEIPTSIFSPVVFAARDDLPPKAYDPERARELLAEAGYPDGFTADLWYTAGGELQISDAVVTVSQMLAQVGIKTSIRVAPDWGVGGPIINSGNFDMYYNGWSTYTLDPDFYVWANFHPLGRNREGTGDRYEFSAEVVRLVELGRFSTDVETRREAYARLQALLWEFPTRLAIVQPYDTYGVRTEVQGFAPRSDQVWDLRHVTLGR